MLEVVKGTTPKMISARVRGVVRIVKTWEKLHVGQIARCAYDRAVAEARELAARMNADFSKKS